MWNDFECIMQIKMINASQFNSVIRKLDKNLLMAHKQCKDNHATPEKREVDGRWRF